MVIKALFNRKTYLIIALIYIFTSTGCMSDTGISTNNYEFDDFSGTELKVDNFSFDTSDIESRMSKIQLKTLIHQSVLVQYKGTTIDLEDIYTKEFIQSIDESFYKTDSSIVGIESVNVKVASENTKSTEKLQYTAHVKIEDSKQKYTQIINFTDIEGNYRIFKITYEE